VGTCKPFDYSGIVGRQCIPLGAADVQRGTNDQLFCGLVTAWNTFTQRATAVYVVCF
jgi:hypothetical protein